MAREWLAASLLVAACPGCSLILDFSDSARPIDAAIDAPYTQAECDYKEPNDTTDTAAVIVAGDVGPAAICARGGDAGGGDDVDYYKFTVSSATMVTIAIQFTNRTGGDLDLRLLDAAGVPITESRGFGDGETIVCPAASPPCSALAPGDYLFEVFPAAAGDVNQYTFSVQ